MRIIAFAREQLVAWYWAEVRCIRILLKFYRQNHHSIFSGDTFWLDFRQLVRVIYMRYPIQKLGDDFLLVHKETDSDEVSILVR